MKGCVWGAGCGGVCVVCGGVCVTCIYCNLILDTLEKPYDYSTNSHVDTEVCYPFFFFFFFNPNFGMARGFR